MKVVSIMWSWLIFMLLFSACIFLAGLGETMRLESFTIAENNVLNQSATPVDVWANYQEFKSTYIFTNEPFTLLLNFVGLSVILYLFYSAWNSGRNSPPLSLSDVFIQWNILLILVMYLGYAIFIYLVNVFVDQLLIVLFSDIYNSIYVYKLLIEYFIALVLSSYLVAWLSNQIKYFDIFERP